MIFIASGSCLAGFLWAICSASNYLNTIENYIDQSLVIKGVVQSINISPEQVENESLNRHALPYIDFMIDDINEHPLKSTIAISLLWSRQLPIPSAGEKWQLMIKTKAAHSYLNQGSFDSQRFAMANRRVLVATINKATLLNPTINFRQTLVNQMLPYANLFKHGDILLALAFGERSRLTSEHKALLFQSGVAHLLAISGMHIMFVAYLGYKLMRGLQLFLPKKLIYYSMPLLASFIIALCYGWLSGFNPPVIRALVALCFCVFLRLQKTVLSPWQIINRIIALLLFYDPLMMLSESFWLSCYAVICLIFIAQWHSSFTAKYQQGYLRQLFKLQVLLTLLLLPIQLLVFNGISGGGVVANIIAIPMITFITFPASLFMMIMSFCHIEVFVVLFGYIADLSLHGLLMILRPLSQYWYSVSKAYYVLSFIGWVGVIIWHTMLWRRYVSSVLLILLIMLAPIFRTAKEQWRVDMLDVGHGLSVIIRKGQSAIVYDTGAT